MNPVKPSAQPANSQFVEIAKNQPEYLPLPAFVDEDGLVMTEWEPTEQERQVLAEGGRIRLWIHTFRNPLQSLQMEAVCVEPRK